MSIPIVGKCFSTVESFLGYLDSIQFGAWRPRYVVMHHTGAPDLKTWQGWQTRTKPVSDDQWLINLKGYYEGLGWSHAPHFFFTPAHYCVFSLPTVRGTHAVSFNANSWSVECVGDFDVEKFEGAVRDRCVAGLAALHIATGLQLEPFEKASRGLHFHRDDPLTSKTCPGTNVKKPELIKLITAKMAAMSAGDHPEEHVVVAPITMTTIGTTKKGVVNVPANDVLNVRGDASGKAPLLATLKPGQAVTITGEAVNGTTKWYKIALQGSAGGWVSAAYINLDGQAPKPTSTPVPVPAPKPINTVRAYCMYGLGGRAWSAGMEDLVAANLRKIPGVHADPTRGFTEWRDIVTDIKAHPGEKYAVLGHSMGAAAATYVTDQVHVDLVVCYDCAGQAPSPIGKNCERLLDFQDTGFDINPNFRPRAVAGYENRIERFLTKDGHTAVDDDTELMDKVIAAVKKLLS